MKPKKVYLFFVRQPRMTNSGKAETPCLAGLFAVMHQRRSVRAYLPERIPDSVLNTCFDLAILAPTSHNLECWQMIEVRDSIRLAALRHLCLDQPAAANSPHLIVAVARPDLWRRGRAMMLEHLQQEKADPTLPKALREFLPLFELKYRLQIPLLFEDGPFHVLAPLKRLLVWGGGLVQADDARTFRSSRTGALGDQDSCACLREPHAGAHRARL